jgi:hypothetical protein
MFNRAAGPAPAGQESSAPRAASKVIRSARKPVPRPGVTSPRTGTTTGTAAAAPDPAMPGAMPPQAPSSARLSATPPALQPPPRASRRCPARRTWLSRAAPPIRAAAAPGTTRFTRAGTSLRSRWRLRPDSERLLYSPEHLYNTRAHVQHVQTSAEPRGAQSPSSTHASARDVGKASCGTARPSRPPPACRARPSALRSWWTKSPR